jgi:hypothetical protein
VREGLAYVFNIADSNVLGAGVSMYPGTLYSIATESEGPKESTELEGVYTIYTRWT